MNTVKSSSPLNRQIYQEACDWLIAFRTEAVGANDREGLDAWLRRSSEHVRAYLEVTAIWEDTALHDAQRIVGTDDHIARARLDVAVVSLRPPTEAESVASESRGVLTWGRKLSRNTLQLAAAACLAVIGLGIVLYNQRGTYSTDIGEQRSIELSDSSVVELSARSKIRVRVTKVERDVELLEGQALFRVARDASRPFVVKSAGTVVRVVGTEFDVYRKKSGTIVTVLEGRVAVTSAAETHEVSPAGGEPEASSFGNPKAQPSRGGELLLTTGEQVTVTAQAVKKTDHADIVAATAWTQRRLIFDSTPLSEVVEEFNRYNSRPMVIASPALQRLEVVGVFSSTDPESLLRFLSAQHIRIDRTDSQIRITQP